MRTVSTDEVPFGERFDFWREASERTWVPYDLRCEPGFEEPFQARMNVCDVGPVQVALMTATPYSIHRTARLIRQDDPGLWKLSVTVHGAGTVTRNGRETTFTAGDLVLHDTSRPYSAAFSAGTPTSRLLVLRFPRSRLPLPDRELNRLNGVRIPGTHGVGALTSAFLLHLVRRIDEYRPADLARLSAVALDLLTAVLAHELDTEGVVPYQTHHRALVARIQAFIHQNLGDPDLSPTSIASAHHISVRYLHKLFQEQERTVVGSIRERRLERCRLELTDPLLAGRPISAIAARWGFPNPAHFAQAFRNAYGMAPSEYRRQQATEHREGERQHRRAISSLEGIACSE